MRPLLRYLLVLCFFLSSFFASFAQQNVENEMASIDGLPAFYSHRIDSMVNACI